MLTNFVQTFHKALKNLIKTSYETSYDLLSVTFREEGIFSEKNSTFSR